MSSSHDANFQLPTLALSTEFDAPVTPMQVPGTLRRGDRALCVLDGANRGKHRLIRFVREAGLVGLKVDAAGEDVRFALRFSTDLFAHHIWWQFSERMAGSRNADIDVDDAPDVSLQHRVVQVAVQGRPRALLLLAPKSTDHLWRTQQQIIVDVPASDIDASGLVMISLGRPDVVPDWLAQDQREYPLVGLGVGEVLVSRPDEPAPVKISTGRPRQLEQIIATERPGAFVVNPGDGATRLHLQPFAGGDQRLLGRRARVKHPVRAVSQLVDDQRLQRGGRMVVDAVTMGGEVVLSEHAVSASDHGFDLTLPAGTGPAYVRARLEVGGAAPSPTNWRIGVRHE